MEPLFLTIEMKTRQTCGQLEDDPSTHTERYYSRRKMRVYTRALGPITFGLGIARSFDSNVIAAWNFSNGWPRPIARNCKHNNYRFTSSP